jgi:hypothetical protein
MTIAAPRTAHRNIIFEGDLCASGCGRELQLVHHLGEVVAGLGGLAEGEALGSRSLGMCASLTGAWLMTDLQPVPQAER